MRMLEDCIDNARPEQKSLVKKARKVLDFGPEIFVNDTVYSKNPEILMEYRHEMGELLNEFNKVK